MFPSEVQKIGIPLYVNILAGSVSLVTVLCCYFTVLEVFPNAGASVDTSALQGGKLSYDYPVVKSFPKPTITWTKSGSALSENERISFSATGNLYIGNVDVNDAGNYQSKVENTVTGQSFNRGTISLGVTGKRHSGSFKNEFLKLMHMIIHIAVCILLNGSNH